jgi:hypothetical protein
MNGPIFNLNCSITGIEKKGVNYAVPYKTARKLKLTI